jgi:hypothetical protein
MTASSLCHVLVSRPREPNGARPPPPPPPSGGSAVESYRAACVLARQVRGRFRLPVWLC